MKNNIIKRLCISLCLGIATLGWAAETKLKQPEAAIQKIVQQIKININQATAEELNQHLNGIGMKKAQRIIDYREQFGSFSAIEQLKEVPGIGEVIYRQNQALLSIK